MNTLKQEPKYKIHYPHIGFGWYGRIYPEFKGQVEQIQNIETNIRP